MEIFLLKISVIFFLYTLLIFIFFKRYKLAIFTAIFLMIFSFLLILKKRELSKKYAVIKKTEFRLAPSLEAPILVSKDSSRALILDHKIGCKDSKGFKKDWYLISSDGDIGWVDEDFVTKV